MMINNKFGLIVILFGTLLAGRTEAAGNDFTGTWTGTMDLKNGDPRPSTVLIKMAEGQLVSTWNDTNATEGAMNFDLTVSDRAAMIELPNLFGPPGPLHPALYLYLTSPREIDVIAFTADRKTTYFVGKLKRK